MNLPSTVNLRGDDKSAQRDGPAFAHPGAVLGNYLLIDELAHGGMGVVFKARQQRPSRIVALKTIRAGQSANARDIRLFKSETEAVAALDHPNIVPIFEVGEDRGLHFYSMKLVVGQTVQDSLIGFKDQPAVIAGLVRQIADAIQHAHERGVLHRDLKPSNILVDAEGKPHVIDFGLAKRLGTEGESTTGLSAAGTPSYMAPEQARGTTGGDHDRHRRLWPGYDSLWLAHRPVTVPRWLDPGNTAPGHQRRAKAASLARRASGSRPRDDLPEMSRKEPKKTVWLAQRAE